MRTPFYDLHQRLAANFTIVDGCEVAADFGDPTAEHHAVRKGAGLLDRSARARIRVSGADRFTWLQGMVSNDVRLLQEDSPSIQACILNATGHLLADVTIVDRCEDLLIDAPLVARPRIFDHLDQFIISEDVELNDETEGSTCISIQGRAVDDAAIRALAHASAAVVLADHTGEGGVDFYMMGAESSAAWDRITNDLGIPPVGHNAAESLRIEAGIPRYGIDMDESTIPLEAGLGPTHISDRKGCYIGQEIIARIQSRGHTNRALTGFFVEGAQLPETGDRILEAEGRESEVGWITSRCHSPTLQRSIALGYLRHEHRTIGIHLRTASAVSLTVSELPFVRIKNV